MIIDTILKIKFFHCFTETLQWHRFDVGEDDGMDRPMPSGRNFHAAVFHARSNAVVMFGGKSNGYMNDLWMLRLLGGDEGVLCGRWEAVEGKGEVPSPRFGHSMNVVGEMEDLLVIGGALVVCFVGVNE